MPNKTWNMEVDMLPSTTGTYNLGNASKKWVINGYELDDACAKGVDSSITAGTTSTNVPTTQAVADYVDGKVGVSVSVSGTTLVITTPPEEEAES